MKDHYEWKPNWYRSEYHAWQAYERWLRLHALALFAGSLTGLAWAGAAAYAVSAVR